MDRRTFLTALGLAPFAAQLPGATTVHAPKGKAEHCIFIWLGGGMGQKISRNHAAKAEVQMKRIGMGKKRGGARPAGKPDRLVRDKRRNPVPPVPFVKGW